MRKIIAIVIALAIILPIIVIFYSRYSPVEETCIISDGIATDPVNNYVVHNVQCMKGIIQHEFLSNQVISETTSGYVIFDKTNKLISTMPLERLKDLQYFGQGGFVQIVLGNSFIVSNNSTNSNSSIITFKDNKLENIADIPHHYTSLAYENEEFYYMDGTEIFKINTMTGNISEIADINSIPRNSLYAAPYYIEVSKANNDLQMSFDIVETHDETGGNGALYILSLYTKVLTLENNDSSISGNRQPQTYQIPAQVKYNIKGVAKDYNLAYNPDNKIGIYNTLLILKKNVKIRDDGYLGLINP